MLSVSVGVSTLEIEGLFSNHIGDRTIQVYGASDVSMSRIRSRDGFDRAVSVQLGFSEITVRDVRARDNVEGSVIGVQGDSNSDGITVSGVRASGVHRCAVRVRAQSHNVTLSDVQGNVDSATEQKDGFIAIQEQATDVTIGDDVHGINYNFGILNDAPDTSDITINGRRFEENDTGMLLRGDEITVNGGECLNNAYQGVFANGATNITLDGVVSKYNAREGIDFNVGGGECAVRNCTLVENSQGSGRNDPELEVRGTGDVTGCSITQNPAVENHCIAVWGDSDAGGTRLLANSLHGTSGTLWDIAATDYNTAANIPTVRDDHEDHRQHPLSELRWSVPPRR